MFSYSTHKRRLLKGMACFLLLVPALRSHAQLAAGTYTVGTAGNYASLTNAGGLFQAINTNGLSGNIVVQITTDLPAETGAYALNQWAGGYSVRVEPATASLKTVTYSGGCGNDMLIFNGPDNLTIDGRFAATGTDRFLRFISACNDESVIRTSLDCVNLTIRNCIISSDNSFTSTGDGGAIHIEENQVNGCDNLKILYNLIEDYSGAIDLFDAVQINAPNPAAAVLDGLEVIGNEIKNADGKGIYTIVRGGNINGAQILRNSFYATGVVSGPGTGWVYAPIQMESGSGHTIRANFIGGQGPLCSGSPMNVQLSGGSDQIGLIRFKIDLPNATMNYIDSNVIRNLSLNGSTADAMSVSLIRIERGNCRIGSLAPNFMGDCTVDASTTATASISVRENNNSSDNTFRAVYTTSTGNVLVTNNRVGGILLQNNSNNGISMALFYSSGSVANFTNNVVGGVVNNIVKQCANTYRVFYSLSDNNPVTITGNTVYGLTANTAFWDNLDVIRVTSGNGAPTITDNVLEYVNMNGSVNTVFMIRVSNPNASIQRNIMRNVSIASPAGGTQFYGVHLTSIATPGMIRDNRISNIQIVTATNVQTNSIGIHATGAAAFTLDANFVERMRIASTNNDSYIRGIHITTANSNMVRNNVVLLDNQAATNDVYVYGIYDDATGGSNSVFFNTVDIRGTMTGARRSACYYRNGSCTRSIQSNIFNNRRAGGSGGHYAEYHNTTGGALISNYNVLYAEESAARVVRFGVNLSYGGWQALGNDANSVNPLSPQNLVNFTNGMQITTVGNNIANNHGILDDHIDAVRPMGPGFDMGAYELDDLILISPMPVGMLSFGLECEAETVAVRWTTATENQSAQFSVESSADGLVWEPLSSVSGQGSSVSQTDYLVYDASPGRDGAYYRVVQQDFDGNRTAYDPGFIHCTETNCEDFRVSSNSAGELEIAPACPTHAFTVTVHAANGQLICSKEAAGEESSIALPGRLSSGVYLVRLTDGSRTYLKRIVI